MLSAEKIQSNWSEFLMYIEKYITGPRKSALMSFYLKYEDRIAMMPASHKKEYPSASIYKRRPHDDIHGDYPAYAT